MEIGKCLAKVDTFCDYVPGLSSVSSLTDLFLKTVIFPNIEPSSIKSSHYYTHLSQKSFTRCIALLIPVIGNILVAIYDFVNRKYDDKDFMLDAIQQNARSFRFASERLKNDKDFILTAMGHDLFTGSLIFKHASEKLKDDKDFMLAASQRSYLILIDASERLRNDKNFMLAAIKKGGLPLQHASERLKDDKDIVLAAIRRYAPDLRWASERLQDDKDVVLTVIRQNIYI
ncbi:MAG: hypothetical protein COT84_06255, partial [Chlamydiae bacterium CG10_big_fil_rev_8_21_14_0_10_35_9]